MFGNFSTGNNPLCGGVGGGCTPGAPGAGPVDPGSVNPGQLQGGQEPLGAGGAPGAGGGAPPASGGPRPSGPTPQDWSNLVNGLVAATPAIANAVAAVAPAVAACFNMVASIVNACCGKGGAGPMPMLPPWPAQMPFPYHGAQPPQQPWPSSRKPSLEEVTSQALRNWRQLNSGREPTDSDVQQIGFHTRALYNQTVAPQLPTYYASQPAPGGPYAYSPPQFPTA